MIFCHRTGVAHGLQALAPFAAEGQCCSAGATCRSTAGLGRGVKAIEPVIPPGVHRARLRTWMQDALDKLYIIPRSRRTRHPGAETAPRQRVLRAVDVGARCLGACCSPIKWVPLSRPAGPDAVSALAPGASALLDQHVPDLGSRIRSGWSATTGESTRCAATATGCAPMKAPSSRPCSARPAGTVAADLRRASPDTASFDNCLNCSPPWPLFAGARGHDDDPLKAWVQQRADG